MWPDGSEARLSGPIGGEGFPSLTEFTERLFSDIGAFPVLANRAGFDLLTVDTASGEVAEVWNVDGIQVRGVGVPHAIVPTIGYRVDVGDASIAFSSDQNGSDPAFIDVLVIHMTVGEDASGFGAQLHAKPSVWGQMAVQGDVGRVVVSHISADSTEVLQGRLDVFQESYSGPLTVGEDLLCVEVE